MSVNGIAVKSSIGCATALMFNINVVDFILGAVAGMILIILLRVIIKNFSMHNITKDTARVDGGTDGFEEKRK